MTQQELIPSEVMHGLRVHHQLSAGIPRTPQPCRQDINVSVIISRGKRKQETGLLSLLVPSTVVALVIPSSTLVIVALVIILNYKWGSETSIVANHFCIIRSEQPLPCVVCSISWLIQVSITGNGVPSMVDDDHPVVELVTDDGISIPQADRSGRQGACVACRKSVSEVLPHDIVVGINLHNPAIV